MYLRLLSSLLILIPLTSCTPLHNLILGAFNIRIFGATKARKIDVMNNIKKVMRDYDVMLVQEIRDKKQGSMDKLFQMLNSDPDVISATSKVNVLVGPAARSSTPFITEFLTLAVVGLHAKPTKAVEEIDHLDEVCSEVKDKLLTQNVVIMGDLNADCSYAKAKELNRTDVFSDTKNFLSLNNDDADTTTYTTNCSYDRIIVSGRQLRSMPLIAEVDRFDKMQGLTDTQTKAVSDHYPVKLIIML